LLLFAGLYDVRGSQEKLSPKRRMPDVRFGKASRDCSNKVYISKLHAETEGHGVESPGPGAYDASHVELAQVRQIHPFHFPWLAGLLAPMIRGFPFNEPI